MISDHAQKIAFRVDSLKLRDRALLLLFSVAAVFLVFDSFGFQPLYQEKKTLLADIEAQEHRLEQLRLRSSRLDAEISNEVPELQLKADLDRYTRRLHSRLDRMLSPDNAADVLAQVIQQEQGLTLNALSTRLTSLRSSEGVVGTGLGIGAISRYELDLQLEGSYLETLYYLSALDALPWKFFWSGITFSVTDYPKASVQLEIFTLGKPRT